MRSCLEIILAVKEQRPASDEELRLAVVALAAMQVMDSMSSRGLAEAVNGNSPAAKFRAGCLLREQEIRFKSMKMPVDEFLGPGNIPGTPENDARVVAAKVIYKRATGKDL